MSVQLTKDDFNKLIHIIQNLPEFSLAKDRHRLVAASLEGVERGKMLLARLDFDGSPMAVATDTIRFLLGFGQVAYGKEAVGVFLNYILPFLGYEDDLFIRNLFENYQLDSPIVAGPHIDDWNGDSINDLNEKIIGENTLRHIYILEKALEAARAVIHLQVEDENGHQHLGSGFMITPNVFMTNNHVIANRKQVEATKITFNYQLDGSGALAKPLTTWTQAKKIFYTSSVLDYSIVSLDDAPEFGLPLKLRASLLRKDLRVSIIQHPGGHLKKISMQNNFVAYADDKLVQYTTTTLPGSSGSPVFNDEFEVVAIHHSGGMLLKPNTSQRYLCNEGISSIAIFNDIKAHVPTLYPVIKD